MYAKGKPQPVPSDAQSREKYVFEKKILFKLLFHFKNFVLHKNFVSRLAVYVYEYLIHVGASQTAEMFLKEVKFYKTNILKRKKQKIESFV